MTVREGASTRVDIKDVKGIKTGQYGDFVPRRRPMNEQGYNDASFQECYRYGEVFVCVGEKSQYVMDLQKKLNQSKCEKGLPPIQVDGVFGPETKERIMINQKSNCKVIGFETQKYKRVKTATGERYVPVKVSGTNLG
jgi:murein L,D-transpeptidase YcbB/YkuD